VSDYSKLHRVGQERKAGGSSGSSGSSGSRAGKSRAGMRSAPARRWSTRLRAEAKQQRGTRVTSAEVWSGKQERRELTTLHSTFYIHTPAGRMAGIHVLSGGR